MALATRETHTVRINEVDQNQNMTLSGLLQLMQETAWNNAEHLGASVYELQRHGISWVMARIKLDIFSYPRHRQQIQVETWPAGSQRSFVYRDYRVYDLEEHLMAQATSTWLVFDIHARKMTNIADFLLEKIVPPPKRIPLERASGRLKLPDQDTGGVDISIRWHDLDPNGHVNNGQYLQWVIEALPNQLNSEQLVRTIDLQIRTECGAGEQILSVAQPTDPSTFIHGLWRQSDNKLIAQAKTIWT
ncbi:MAG: acyl-ACP thioesterase domain-containing protein [Bacteroidota bacterium]